MMTPDLAVQALLWGLAGGTAATYLIKRQRAKVAPLEEVSVNLDDWVKLTDEPAGWGVGQIVALRDDDDLVQVAWDEETCWERKSSLTKVTDPVQPLRKNEPDPQ